MAGSSATDQIWVATERGQFLAPETCASRGQELLTSTFQRVPGAPNTLLEVQLNNGAFRCRVCHVSKALTI